MPSAAAELTFHVEVFESTTGYWRRAEWLPEAGVSKRRAQAVARSESRGLFRWRVVDSDGVPVTFYCRGVGSHAR
jgi:hypothetical protein